MRVVLKECAWERTGTDLVVIFDPREAVTLVDPEGQVEALLAELSRGPRTIPQLADALAAQGCVTSADTLAEALSALDSLGLVDDGDGIDLATVSETARHRSNLTFFRNFSRLDRPPAEFQRRMRRSHVLALGVGGVGCSAVMCLAGMGVGRITLVDRDDLEPKNFARQFLYRHAQVGSSKVACAAEWVRDYDPTIEVRAVDRWISSAEELMTLVDEVDLIAGGLDGHADAPLWVNEAAVRAGVPLVVGGMTRTEITYYSVDPGRSACLQCDQAGQPGPEDVSAAAISRRRWRDLDINNGLTGPLAMQLGSLAAYEAMRYLTGFEPPYAAGAAIWLDVRNGLLPERRELYKDPHCRICAQAPTPLPRWGQPVVTAP